MDKKNMNIESYDGQDAFYTGSDEEYAEFLKNADIKLNDGEKAEAVENTQRINLNETINIQSVIDKFKKTAGGIENSAKKFKDTVVNTMDMFKTKNENNSEDENDTEHCSDTNESSIAEKIKTKVSNSAEKMNDFKEGVEAIPEMKSDFSSVKNELSQISADVAELSRKLDGLADKVKTSEIKNKESSIETQSFHDDLRRGINDITASLSEMKQTVGSVTKVNDSIFDLKNTQHNTKNALLNLENAFNRLRKKCVLGVTVLSFLSAIVIALEILLMLS